MREDDRFTVGVMCDGPHCCAEIPAGDAFVVSDGVYCPSCAVEASGEIICLWSADDFTPIPGSVRGGMEAVEVMRALLARAEVRIRSEGNRPMTWRAA